MDLSPPAFKKNHNVLVHMVLLSIENRHAERPCFQVQRHDYVVPAREDDGRGDSPNLPAEEVRFFVFFVSMLQNIGFMRLRLVSISALGHSVMKVLSRRQAKKSEAPSKLFLNYGDPSSLPNTCLCKQHS